MALGSEAVGLGSLQKLPGGAVREHCWVSSPWLLPSLVRWSARPQGSVVASDWGPQSKNVEGAVDGGAAGGGRCLSDG